MAAEDGLKAQKLLAQGSALGNVGKNKVALKGQKLSISKLLPFQGDFVVFILKPRALPWAKSFCPFRAYGMWLMTHPLFFVSYRLFESPSKAKAASLYSLMTSACFIPMSIASCKALAYST